MMIVTILSDILMSLRLTRLLEFVALVVVVFLVSSPGFVGTVIGISTKLGIYKHVTTPDKAEETAA